jgi:Fic family protein
LGDLSGTGRLLPNPYILISPYVRREAVHSSRIEGTQASLDDLFYFEAAEIIKPEKSDVKEVHNYILAMEEGLRLLADLPISVRLIRRIHEVLMKDVRSESAAPGELRRSQNWIGPSGCTLNDATFIPPAVEDMKEALSDWEKYLHSNPSDPPLIQCALMHYQFEAIHPFLDGNGRIGRLLIAFLLCERGILSQPLLYLSSYLDRFRDEYYARLLAVSQKGNWQGWFEFFLRGVSEQSKIAINDSRAIIELHWEYRDTLEKLKKIPSSSYKILDALFENPVLSIAKLSKRWNIPYNSVKTAVLRLVDVGILRLVPGFKRRRLYFAPKLLDLLTKGENN